MGRRLAHAGRHAFSGGERLNDDDEKVVDLSRKIAVKKFKEGPSFIFCRVCESEEHGFAVQGRFNHSGAYYIQFLICLNPACGGESQIDIEGGFVIG